MKFQNPELKVINFASFETVADSDEGVGSKSGIVEGD